MTNITLKAQIDSQITNETLSNSISPTDVGGNLKSVVDYIDQEVANASSGGTKTTIQIEQSSSTPVPLTGYFNILSYSGGYSYLPSSNFIGKEVIVATNFITNIQADLIASSLLIDVWGAPVSSLVMQANETRRFTFIGLGSGEGGLINGFWKAELI